LFQVALSPRRRAGWKCVQGRRNSKSDGSKHSPQYQCPFGRWWKYRCPYGPDGKLLVDAEIVTACPNVSKALANINADPIKQQINTHWHFDHTSGNEWVHETRASIGTCSNRCNLKMATFSSGI